MLKEQSTPKEKSLSKVIKIDEARIKNHLGEVVRSTVEPNINEMLPTSQIHRFLYLPCF